MVARMWKVGLIKEFYPKSGGLLGQCVCSGQVMIKIRLRDARNKEVFLEGADLVGTLLHELAHIGEFGIRE